MEYVYLGKIVNTHGIKGEIRIQSNFEFKKYVFKKDFNLYIGKEKVKEIINTYRYHKIYDMVTFNDITNINDVLKYKGENVYALRTDLPTDIVLPSDLIGLECYTNKYIGKVKDVIKNKFQKIILIENDGKKIMIPWVDNFIKKIDLIDKKIYINEIEGLIDEN